MKKYLMAAVFLAIAPTAQADTPKDIVNTYADIAHAMYSDSLSTAKTLNSAVHTLIVEPSDMTMKAARAAWLAARVPYQQTEGYRFGNPIVDDWEGKVNAWPLDEGLIDYVDPTYGKESDANPYYTANIIANPSIKIGGKMLDAKKIDAKLLSDGLHELDGVEANVATGYHAIEFLLWGQDLNGSGPGAGNRPYTDFDPKNCTNGNCDRRAAYLSAASTLLVADLHEMVDTWAANGEARAAITTDPKVGIIAMMQGLGSLSYGELAGERMKLGLMLHDPEEEHDCFADNTHNSHFYNQIGMMAIYNGRYVRIDGTVVEGASLARHLSKAENSVAAKITMAMMAVYDRLYDMKVAADERRMAYDEMLAEGNPLGNKIIQDAIDALVVQAKSFEAAMAPLGITSMAFEGSESLDNPNAVFK